MGQKFKVKVNDSLNFSLSSTQAEKLDLIETSESKYHILHENKAFSAELISNDFQGKQYVITVNSNTYKIKISDELDLLIEKMGFSLGNNKKLNHIKAPMPGIIIGLEVKEGDEVREGDTLLILEAMKMENAIVSPKNGKVKSVGIELNNTVEKGKLLIELE